MIEVAIIDYRMGNLHSVKAACEKVGLTAVITSDHSEILDSKAAILPGVGAFGEAIAHIKNSNLDNCIYSFIESGRPFIGICLGLQLLFEKSEEFGNNTGLKIIKGKIKKFNNYKFNNIKYPVPQVGWNKVEQANIPWENTLLSKVNYDDYMYFVHSYYIVPENKNIILSTTKYGNHNFCSAIQKKNIFATQYHPEKSGPAGLKIYEKLKEMIK